MHGRIVGEQQRVPGEELGLTDHREPGFQSAKDRGVLAAVGAADAIGPKIIGHHWNLARRQGSPAGMEPSAHP
ncbi:hypothetical protein GCM10027167_15240 [Nocardia heshunensis]